MIFELAQIEVRRDAEAAFEAAVVEAKPLIERADGCHGVTLYRGIEQPHCYRLMVKWDSVEKHEAFRRSPDFQRWRELASPHFASPPTMDHMQAV